VDAAALLSGTRPPLVRVRALCKRYGRRVAVDGADLEVEPGQIYGLIGPDGAGKSSLMKAVAGVLSYEAGRVEVFGEDLGPDAAAERVKERIGFLPQGLGLSLYPELTVEENIDFFGQLRQVPESALVERKERLLSFTRLLPFRTRPMKQLSGGMKQKLGLICALIHEPELAILDEPTTGVDPVSRRDFWAILSELLRQHGTTAVVSTAYMDEASRFDRLALMHGGRILAEGTPEQILALAPGRLVWVRAEPQMEALARLHRGSFQVEAQGLELRLYIEEPDAGRAVQGVREALDGLDVGRVEAAEPELEDVFIALLRREGLEPRTARPDSDPAAGLAPRRDGAVAIEARELTRDFGSFRAVDRVSFRVPQGQIFGLLGANGAGKTTVIKMLTGILPPSAGTGQVAGADMRRASQAIKRRIGYVSQSFSLYQDLTVLENIELYAGIYGLGGAEARRRTAWALEMGTLGGHERDLAGRLPIGLRQRLALGCALLHRPEVLFLDEPTSGVDPLGRRELWENFFELSRREGVAILVTTHVMAEAEHCDRLALMFSGRIVADAAPGELRRQVEAEEGRLLELEVDRPAQAVEWLTRDGFSGAALFGRRVHVLSRRPGEDLEEIPRRLAAEGLAVRSIVQRPLTMEDVFVTRVQALERQELAAGDRP
jgi:drug efflux transport system ATP-binding protein